MCEDHTHSFQSAVLIHEVHVLTSHIYKGLCNITIGEDGVEGRKVSFT